MNPLEQYSLEELQERTSEKWTNYSKDVLPMWVAEMDVKLPEQLVSRLTTIAQIGDLGYLSQAGFDAFAKAFCDFTQRHWGWKHQPSHIADVPDVVDGCVKVINAYLQHDPKNTVIYSSPIYPPFLNKYAVGYNGVDARLTENDYRLDFAALEVAFANATLDGCKAAYALCNPSNPTGTVHTQDELTRLCELASKYGVLIVSDEIHGPLVTERNYEHDGHTLTECNNPPAHGKHSTFIPILSLPEAEFVVTVCSVSKAFSIAGLKAALVIPSAHSGGKAQDLIWNSGQFRQASSEQVGAIAQTVCMNECDDWLYHLVQAIRNNLIYFKALAKQYFPKAHVHIGNGTYFAWVDFGPYFSEGTLAEKEPAEFILQHAKVAFNPGRTFALPMKTHWSGMPLPSEETGVSPIPTRFDNFVRVNLASSQEIIRMACERIGEVLR